MVLTCDSRPLTVTSLPFQPSPDQYILFSASAISLLSATMPQFSWCEPDSHSFFRQECEQKGAPQTEHSAVQGAARDAVQAPVCVYNHIPTIYTSGRVKGVCVGCVCVCV